jgi:AcrR family transcriptional regulator
MTIVSFAKAPVAPVAPPPPASTVAIRKRLPRLERERMIIDEAIRFFAENGFEGQTRALAERLGVTQPLLYRYFPDKESLIDRVYDEVYAKRWNTDWDALLRDPQLALGERLTRFYREFSDTYFTYTTLRIYLFAGLKGVKIRRRGQVDLGERVVNPICDEVRRLAGLPLTAERPLSVQETEIFYSMHASFFYRALRQWVYGVEIREPMDEVIAATIGCFVDMAPKAFARLAAQG